MKWSWAFSSSMSSAALLLPFLAVGDSQVRSRAAAKALSATAHVDFKIMIPTVLYLEAGGVRRGNAPQTVAIRSNSRTVALSASAQPSGEAPYHVVLNAAARKGISQEAACAPPAAASSSAARLPGGANSRTVCTASMP